jgi:hypothetical protein
MQLTLTDEDARTLHDLLADILPELRMEAARTDLASRELLHELMHRRKVCQKAITQLAQSSCSDSTRPHADEL